MFHSDRIPAVSMENGGESKKEFFTPWKNFKVIDMRKKVTTASEIDIMI